LNEDGADTKSAPHPHPPPRPAGGGSRQSSHVDSARHRKGGEIFLLPPPLWGRVRVGGVAATYGAKGRR
jgi:hypothetical protein